MVNNLKWIIGLVFILLLIGNINLTIIDAADIKMFEKNMTSDMSAFIKEDFNSKYGAIQISKTFLWIPTDKIAEYSLIKNTEYCMINCEAEGRVSLYTDGKIFDNVRFETLDGKSTSITSHKYLIFSNYKNVTVTVPDTYKQVCAEIAAKEINGTIKIGDTIKSCHDEVNTTKTINQTIEVWDDYVGEILKAGDYRWKIKGVKSAEQSVDFIPSIVSNGNKIDFSEWAVWTSGMNNGLVAYWKMNETSGADSLDSVSGVYNLTNTGSYVANPNGKIGYANNYTSGAYGTPASTLAMGTNDFTWCAWAKWNSMAATNNKGVIGGLDRQRVVISSSYSTSNRISSWIGDGSSWSTCNDMVAPFDASVQTWYFVCLTRASDTNITLWVNGTSQASTLITAGWNVGGSQGIAKGAVPDGENMNGVIDEVGYWNRSLTASEISDLYNEGTGITYKNDFGAMAVVNSIPTNNSNITTKTIVFGCNATGTDGNNITSIVLNITDGTNIWTQTNGSLNTDSFNATFTNSTLLNGIYTWNCLAYGDIKNGTSSFWTLNQQAYTPPSVIWDSQTPSDLNLTNFIGAGGVNITYNITNITANALNTSTITLYYKSNTTYSNVMFYQNGTAFSGFFPKTYTDNSSSTFRFNLLDNEVLPGTYNFGEVSMENTPHTRNTLVSAADYIGIQLYNVSNITRYSFLEVMSNSTAIQRFYACNSSFAATTNPATASFCTLIFTEAANAPWDHNHTIYSSHHVIPFTINATTGSIGTVKVTPTMWFFVRGNAGGGNVIGFYSITNTTRIDAMRTTTNNGNNWASQTYTVDAHLHQFPTGSEGNATFYYYSSANDTSNNTNISSLRFDMFELGGIEPTSPTVYSPANQTYKGIISINYTSAESPSGFDMSNYNITLWNADGTFNQTINATNGLNLSYLWDSSGIKFGSFYVQVDVNDTNNLKSFGQSDQFTIDNQNPSLVINTPTNTTYTISINLPLNATVSDGNLDTCKYSLNGAANITYVCNTIQAITAIQGSNNIYVYVNDSVNNENSSTVTFSVDSIIPQVKIEYPLNTSYNINVSELNYTYSDTNIGKCWYSRDNGATRSNEQVPGTNFTNVESVEGSNTWIVYCNDTFGNQNQSNITFFKHTIPPMINIVYPENKTYNNVYELNYTVYDLFPDSCWYSKNNGILNSTPVASGINFTSMTSLEGTNTWTVYCNDTENNLNQSSITFTKDSIFPAIAIYYPQNTSYNNSVTELNYTVSDTNLDSCWYSIDLGVTNVSIICGNNATALVSNEGSNTWIAYANDSTGNVNYSSITFFKDTIFPQINFTYNTDSSGSYVNRDSIRINVSANDTNLINVTIRVYNSSHIQVGSSSWTNSGSGSFWYNSINSDGLYYFNATVIDKYGNYNYTETRNVTIDTIYPRINLTYPMNTTYSTNVSELNYSVSDTNLDSCWYSLNFGMTNTSIACGTNASSITSTEGSNTWTVYANDSVGYTNESTVSFTKDSDPPTMNYETPTPTNASSIPLNTFTINVSASDVSLRNITLYYWKINGTIQTQIVTSTTNSTNNVLTQTNLSDGVYYYNATATDSFSRTTWLGTRNVNVQYTNQTVGLCKELFASNTNYIIAADLTSATTCLNVTGTNVNIYCQGHTIIGNDAILVTKPGLTLRDCIVSSSTKSALKIRGNSPASVSVYNTTFQSSPYGINIAPEGSLYADVITLISNDFGIYFNGSNNGNTLKNILMINNFNDSLTFINSSHNSMYNLTISSGNDANNNGIVVFNTSTDNRFDVCSVSAISTYGIWTLNDYSVNNELYSCYYPSTVYDFVDGTSHLIRSWPFTGSVVDKALNKMNGATILYTASLATNKNVSYKNSVPANLSYGTLNGVMITNSIGEGRTNITQYMNVRGVNLPSTPYYFNASYGIFTPTIALLNINDSNISRYHQFILGDEIASTSLSRTAMWLILGIVFLIGLAASIGFFIVRMRDGYSVVDIWKYFIILVIWLTIFTLIYYVLAWFIMGTYYPKI